MSLLNHVGLTWTRLALKTLKDYSIIQKKNIYIGLSYSPGTGSAVASRVETVGIIQLNLPSYVI